MRARTLLAKHQDVQHLLRSECSYLASFKAGSLPTLVEIEGMRYMKYVLDEGNCPVVEVAQVFSFS